MKKKKEISYKPNKYLRRVIKESREEFERQKADGTLKIFKTVDELMKDLKS